MHSSQSCVLHLSLLLLICVDVKNDLDGKMDSDGFFARLLLTLVTERIS